MRPYVALLLTLLGLAACGTPTGGDPAASASNGAVDPTRIAFDTVTFVDPTQSSNTFHPLTPGMQWVYAGSTEVGSREVPHEVIVTMTDVIRTIDGAPAIAMLSESTDSGEVAQVGMDYMGLDDTGNVWILGGYTEEFEGGEYTNTESAWLGEGNGQTVGILIPALVDADTPAWLVGGAPDEDPSVAFPVEIDAEVCVAFGCFDRVRVIQEGEIDAPDNENKYYAPGVGVVNNVPLDASLHQDRFELVNLVELTPQGIAEASQTVLDLEAHGLETAADVFNGQPDSRRAT